MILLKPTIQNKVALMLTSITTVTNPVYLFELVNNQTNERYYFIAQDTSQFTYSYNLFLITVKTNPNPLVGEVDLTIPEEYTYNVYEQQSTTNLNPNNATLIQTGILRYEKEYTSRQAYTRGETTRAVYKR
jgi:hypothetical protein